MSRISVIACLLVLCLAQAAWAEEIDCVTTEWKLIGANHKVCVNAFQDPDIPCVTCYISQARTGGLSGSVGLAEDPSEFSIECRQTGTCQMPSRVPRSKKVFSEGTSILFKDTQVTRIFDEKRNVLVYLAVSRKIIAGSPKNSLSTVQLK
ncbi:CreA family protein [Fundidesulfovibrio butyratiphilus]